jgi:hypothetical protein
MLKVHDICIYTFIPERRLTRSVKGPPRLHFLINRDAVTLREIGTAHRMESKVFRDQAVDLKYAQTLVRKVEKKVAQLVYIAQI